METTMQLPDQQVLKSLILKSNFIERKYKHLQSWNEATEGLLESVQSEMMVMGELK